MDYYTFFHINSLAIINHPVTPTINRYVIILFMKSIVTKNLRSSFKDRVLTVVKDIPRGQVMTYKKVAEVSGAGGAARAVGTIMSQNKDRKIPCHRVVKSDGTIGGYNGLRTDNVGQNAKTNLLKKEGVKFTKSGKVIF